MIKLVDAPQIVLLYPKTGMDIGSTVAPPHALLSVAAPLVKAGFKVAILDQRVTPITPNTIRGLLTRDLIVFGISSMTGTQISYALSLAKMCREVAGVTVPIVWGGCHPSILPEQTLEHDNVDIVITGEGDDTFLELVQARLNKRSFDGIKGIVYKKGNKIIKNELRPLLDVENLLPVPWELIDVEQYIHPDMYLNNKRRVLDIGQTSRGCPFQCGFCSSSSLRQRRWRPMSAERSIDMITSAVRRFNLDGIWLRDDEFYIDRSRANAICQGIIRNNLDISFYTSGTRVDVFNKASDEEIALLKAAGAHTLKFGAESGSPRILKLMNKGITPEQTLAANQRCKKHGIRAVFSLMVGYPTETFEDINMTIDLGYRIQQENPDSQLETMAIYTSLPGTPDFPLAMKHGLKPPETLEGWANWIFDEYDPQGQRSPWFSAAEREYLGNISYMSILANALVNVSGSIKIGPARFFIQNIAKFVSHYYKLKLKNKMYKWAPELRLIRRIRRELFYTGDIRIS